MYTTTKHPKIATKLIHTYKIIIPYWKFWKSMFYDAVFSYGHLVDERHKLVSYDTRKQLYEVERGFFYSTTDYECVVKIKKAWRGVSCEIVRCIIPIGHSIMKVPRIIMPPTN